MKRVKLIGIPMSKNWHFGKEDIDEMIFMLQVKMIYIYSFFIIII